MTNSAARLNTAERRADDRLVIHHLADLDFDQTDEHHPLFEYFSYLNELDQRKVESAEHQAVVKTSGRIHEDADEHRDAPELPPDIVIITGNITRPKSEADWQRRALSEAAAALRASLRSARHDLRETVFVVPGFLDVSWEKRVLSLDPFAQAFSQFAIPVVTGGSTTSHLVVKPKDALFTVHLVNTCPSPSELLALPRSASKALEQALKDYEKALSSCEKHQRKHPGRYDGALDRQLATAVSALLEIVDGGRVLPADYTAFARACTELADAEDDHRLKILMTHHCLLTSRDFLLPRIGPTGFGATLALAREHGFHLAFHGHSARPQALAELPLEDRTGLLRHIGAPNLRQTRSYTEIVARRSAATSRWRFETRAIALTPTSFASQTKPTYILLSPLADVLKPRSPDMTEAAKKREAFEKELRITLRLLSEEIEGSSEEIPHTPLVRLQQAIQDILFAGFDTLVGLALKDAHPSNGRAMLQSMYIDPGGYADFRYAHPFDYPTTPPAWALILERILAYPRDFGTDLTNPPNVITKEDLDWLNATDRYAPIRDLLYHYRTALTSDRELTAEVRQREQTRAERLYEKFAGIGASRGIPTLHLRDTVQFPEGESLPFDEVIYVPIPRRPRGGVGSPRTEIGTLIIEVTRRKDPDGKPLRPEESILTEEREDMLRTVSDVIYLTLLTADRLNRPKGRWLHHHGNAR